MKVSTLWEVFYGDLQCFTVITACWSLFFKYCSWINKLNVFCTWKRSEIMVSRFPGEVGQKWLCLISIFQRESNLEYFKLAIAWYSYAVPETSTVCVTYLDVAWKQRFENPGRNLSSFYFVFTTPVLISVFQACYQVVCKVLFIQQVLLFVEPTQIWPEIMISRVLGEFYIEISIFGIQQCRLDFKVFLPCILLVK